jgi:hypothetical protein
MSKLGERTAYTLLEFVVASSLSVTLMAIVLGLTGQMTARWCQLREVGHRQPAWEVRLQERVRWDLEMARQYLVDEQGVHLFGWGSWDARCGLPTGQPVEVVYQIRQLRGRHWLARIQIPSEMSDQNLKQIELLCDNVVRSDVTVARRGGFQQVGNMSAPSSLPTSLRWTLYADRPDGRPLVQCGSQPVSGRTEDVTP